MVSLILYDVGFDAGQEEGKKLGREFERNDLIKLIEKRRI